MQSRQRWLEITLRFEYEDKVQLSNSMLPAKTFQHRSLVLPDVAGQLSKGACPFANLGHGTK